MIVNIILSTLYIIGAAMFIAELKRCGWGFAILCGLLWPLFATIYLTHMMTEEFD